MNILITNALDVKKNLYFDKPYILISITSHGTEHTVPNPLDYNRIATLFITFDDCSQKEADYVSRMIKENPENYEKNLTLLPLTLEQAHEIWDFIDTYYPLLTDNILFQCEAGISRSAGCAAGVLQSLGFDNSVCYGPRYYPNIHVKSTMMHAKRERSKQ